MDHLKKDNKDKYKKQFSHWETTLTNNKVQNLEALYKKIHAEIRKSPARPKVEKKNAAVRKVISKAGDKSVINQDSKGRKWLRHKKLSKKEKMDRVKAKILKATKGGAKPKGK